jgi:hypothetical protein
VVSKTALKYTPSRRVLLHRIKLVPAPAIRTPLAEGETIEGRLASMRNGGLVWMMT